MPNLLDKAIKLTAKGHRIKHKLLMPKGRKAYILKGDHRTKAWTILAIFEYFGVEFSRFRSSEYFEFAAGLDQTFPESGAAKRMSEVAAISTHIATVDQNGDTFVHAIRRGDEDKPHYLDFTWKFYTFQVSDKFDPAVNV